MATGLTFEEYLDLKKRPLAYAGRHQHEAVESGVQQMFPMHTSSASIQLRSRGYDCRPEMLELLVKNGTIVLAQPDMWTREHVDAAAAYFEDCAMFTPYAAMCDTLGCSYADFLRPLREAAERESVKYGRPIGADDQLFVMHRIPPRGVTGPDGNLAEIKPAVISFTLADDIRERLERGEEV